MTKRKKNPSQIALPIGSELVGLDRRIKRALAATVKHPQKSRQQIADELSARLARRITVAQLDNWASAAHSHMPPADIIAALVVVTGSLDVLNAMCGPVGVLPITGRDITYLELAKALRKRQRLDREIQELEERLK